MIRFLTVERTNANAVRACLRLARDNGHVVRDRLSGDAWEILNALWTHAAPHLERTYAEWQGTLFSNADTRLSCSQCHTRCTSRRIRIIVWRAKRLLLRWRCQRSPGRCPCQDQSA